MTNLRAQEILKALGNCTRGYPTDYFSVVSQEEDAVVKAVWDDMPGYTTRFDALLRISKGRP